MDQKLGTAYVELEARAQKLEKDFKDAQDLGTKSGKKIGTTFNEALSGAIGKWGAFTAAVTVAGFAIKKAADFMRDLVLQGAQLQNLKSAFQGTSDDLKDFRKATAGTVSDANLLKLSNQASDLGVTLEQQKILFSMAEDAADKYGGGVEEGMSKVIAASEGSSRGLKSLGIQSKLYEQSVKELAKAHGGEIEQLDAETQKQIRLEAIIRASGVTIDDVKKKVKDNADKVESASASWENLKAAIGNLFTPAIAPLFDKLAKAAEGWTIAFSGPQAISGGAERQAAFFESIKDYSKEELATLEKQTKQMQDKAKVGMINNGMMSSEYKIARAQVFAFQEQLDVIKDIDKWKNKDKPDDKNKGLTDEEKKRKIDLEKQIFNELDKTSIDYYNGQRKLIKDSVAEMRKLGINSVNIKKWEIEQKKKLDNEYYSAKADKDAFDLLYGKRAKKEIRVYGYDGQNRPKELSEKWNGNYNEDPFRRDLTDTEITEAWIDQSDAMVSAYNVAFDSISSGFDMISIKASETASKTEQFFVNMGNVIIDEIQRILTKWAVLNIFSFAAGGPGIGLLSMLGIGGKAVGGPVSKDHPYIVGERGPELYVPERSGYIVPNNVLKSSGSLSNTDVSKIVSQLQILNSNVGRSSGGKVDVNVNGKIGNQEIYLSQAKESKFRTRFGG